MKESFSIKYSAFFVYSTSAGYMLKIASLFIYADDVLFMINPGTLPVFPFNRLPYSLSEYIKMAFLEERNMLFTPEINTQRCYLGASVWHKCCPSFRQDIYKHPRFGYVVGLNEVIQSEPLADKTKVQVVIGLTHFSIQFNIYLCTTNTIQR